MKSNDAEAGDIIFIYTPGTGAKGSVWGQNVLRARDVLRRRKPSNFSHVMMATGPGRVIHADGKSIKSESFAQATKALDARSRFQVWRPEPALTSAEQAALVANADRYIQQKYSFFKISKRLGFSRHETRPFCSELISAAYQAIGRPILDRQPNSILPVDLEVACVGPSWVNVTELYAAAAGPSDIDVFFADIEEQVEDLWRKSAALSATKREFIASTNSARDQIARINALDVSSAVAFSEMKIEISAEAWIPFVAHNMGQLASFYAAIFKGMEAEFADQIDALFADIPADTAFYEGLPSAAEIRARENRSAFHKILGPAMRMEMSLNALAHSMGVPTTSPTPRFQPHAPAAKVLTDNLASLDAAAAMALTQAIAALVVPNAPDETADLQARSSNVVALHRALK